MIDVTSWWAWAWSGAPPAFLKPAEPSSTQVEPQHVRPPPGTTSPSHTRKPAAACSTVELSSEISEPNGDSPDSVDAERYKRVCDLRKKMLDSDPTVKFMLQKLEEVWGHAVAPSFSCFC